MRWWRWIIGAGVVGGIGGVAQGLQLVLRRFLVHPEELRHLLGNQRLGRGDIGEDHEFLDQPVRIQPVAEVDRLHLALFAELDAPLRQVEV